MHAVRRLQDDRAADEASITRALGMWRAPDRRAVGGSPSPQAPQLCGSIQTTEAQDAHPGLPADVEMAPAFRTSPRLTPHWTPRNGATASSTNRARSPGR